MPGQDVPSLPGIAGSTALAATPTPGSAQAYALAEKADATRRAYRSDFEMFGAWCRARRNVEPLGTSPDTVAAYLAAQASANAAVHETEQQLALAFRDGSGAAASWANLMRSNDAGLMLATCTGTAVKVIEGRRACNMPVWLDPPNPAVPSRAR